MYGPEQRNQWCLFKVLTTRRTTPYRLQHLTGLNPKHRGQKGPTMANPQNTGQKKQKPTPTHIHAIHNSTTAGTQIYRLREMPRNWSYSPEPIPNGNNACWTSLAVITAVRCPCRPWKTCIYRRMLSGCLHILDVTLGKQSLVISPCIYCFVPLVFFFLYFFQFVEFPETKPCQIAHSPLLHVVASFQHPSIPPTKASSRFAA